MKTKKKYNLLLINPRQEKKHFAQQVEFCNLMGKKSLLTPLALPTVAALTPGNYEIAIIDEEIQEIPLDTLPDIVGITTLAHTIKRVYEIADMFRARGVTVVLGGSYASYMPEEGLEHADSIVIGEAEDIWAACLRDFESGRMKETYRAKKFTPFNKSPLPRWDLVETSSIVSLGVQVSRGCPYKCEFCLVNKLQGNTMRYRDMDDVIEEIKALPKKNIFFVDDNLTVNKQYMRRFLERIKPLNISWTCQASIDVGNDEEMLKDMAEAGCMYILVGFESVNEQCLTETHKKQNRIENYEGAIARIHRAGIQIIGAFIVGFDHDTLDEFDNIYEFSVKANLPLAMINILGVAPGTDIYERLKKEKRIYADLKDGSIGMFSPIRYMNMSHTEMFDRYLATLEKMYSFKTVGEKARKLFGQGRFTIAFTGEDPGAWFKFAVTMKVLGSYRFSPDRYKRQMFVDMFRLFRQKKIAPDKFFVFMLTMEGFSRYVSRMKKNAAKLRAEVAANDRGAWKDSSR